jgi:hypothetical protein
MPYLGKEYKVCKSVRKVYGVNKLLISLLREFRTVVRFFTDFLKGYFLKKKNKENNKIYTALKINAVYQFEQLLETTAQEITTDGRALSPSARLRHDRTVVLNS